MKLRPPWWKETSRQLRGKWMMRRSAMHKQVWSPSKLHANWADPLHTLTCLMFRRMRDYGVFAGARLVSCGPWRLTQRLRLHASLVLAEVASIPITPSYDLIRSLRANGQNGFTLLLEPPKVRAASWVFPVLGCWWEKAGATAAQRRPRRKCARKAEKANRRRLDSAANMVSK